MLLDLVTKRLLIAVLSWVLELLARSLPSWVWCLCVATLMLPLLDVRIVILAFLFSLFYLRSKRVFLHSNVGAVVPTAVVGLSSTVFPVEMAGTRLFVAVVVFGTLVLMMQNMQCAAEVVVRIQAVRVSLYCPSLTLRVVLLTH